MAAASFHFCQDYLTEAKIPGKTKVAQNMEWRFMATIRTAAAQHTTF